MAHGSTTFIHGYPWNGQLNIRQPLQFPTNQNWWNIPQRMPDVPSWSLLFCSKDLLLSGPVSHVFVRGCIAQCRFHPLIDQHALFKFLPSDESSHEPTWRHAVGKQKFQKSVCHFLVLFLFYSASKISLSNGIAAKILGRLVHQNQSPSTIATRASVESRFPWESAWARGQTHDHVWWIRSIYDLLVGLPKNDGRKRLKESNQTTNHFLIDNYTWDMLSDNTLRELVCVGKWSALMFKESLRKHDMICYSISGRFFSTGFPLRFFKTFHHCLTRWWIIIRGLKLEYVFKKQCFVINIFIYIYIAYLPHEVVAEIPKDKERAKFNRFEIQLV